MPARPVVECKFERAVGCQPPSPVRRAWQPPPFVECRREIPFNGNDMLAQKTAQYSPRETRTRRLAGAFEATPASAECCYVQFDTTLCR